MNRRLLLKLLAAGALLGCNAREESAKGLRVVVVGAGIIGASIAWHLAKAGALVTVIDKDGPASHASRGTFAWINATWAKQPQHYHALNQSGVSSWHGLQHALNIPIRWNGSLEWFDNPDRQARLADQIAEQVAWGERARMVGVADFATLESNVDFGGAQTAAFSENDGALDPVVATSALLGAARSMGADVRFPCKLQGLSSASGRLSSVETSQGRITTDRLVLATGAEPGAGKLFSGIDIPQRSTAGIIAITAALPPLLNRIIVAPGIHMHQRNDGRVVLGEQEGAPHTAAHAIRLQNRPNAFPTEALAEQHATRLLSIAGQFLPEIANVPVEHVYIGWRPLPLDGHPVLGASPINPNVYLAIMHSGVSLAPIVGQLVAHELTDGVAIDQLKNYRPDRTFDFVKRY